MKTLVLQVNIPPGTWRHRNYAEMCMPTVENWASKHGYDYTIVDRLTRYYNGCDHSCNCFLERYQHFYKRGYDRVIQLENDVEVMEHAPAFPTSHPLILTSMRPMSSHPMSNIPSPAVVSVDAATGIEMHQYFNSLDEEFVFHADMYIMQDFYYRLEEALMLQDGLWNYVPDPNFPVDDYYFRHWAEYKDTAN